MTRRRSFLFAGFVLLAAAFLRPAIARATVELQAAGFGGTESAYYGSCGGSAVVQAKYGGVGVTARAHPFYRPAAADADEPVSGAPRAPAPTYAPRYGVPSGFAMVSTLAGNVTSVRLKSCTGDCAGLEPARFPVEQLQLGGNLRLGADWRWFGFGLGALAWQQVIEPGQVDESPGGGDGALAALPDVQLRFGPQCVLYVETGVGAYNEPTVLRPGIYAGLGTSRVEPWQVEMHYGVHWPLGSGEGVGRLDVAVHHRLGERTKVGIGAAWTEEGTLRQGEGFEGRVSIAQRY